MLKTHQIQKKYIQLFLKKGKKEKTTKKYEELLFQIKRNMLKQPQQVLNNLTLQLLRPIALHQTSKFNYTIKYQQPKKQINTVIKFLMQQPKLAVKIKKLNINNISKLNSNFYKDLARYNTSDE